MEKEKVFQKLLWKLEGHVAQMKVCTLTRCVRQVTKNIITFQIVTGSTFDSFVLIKQTFINAFSALVSHKIPSNGCHFRASL